MSLYSISVGVATLDGADSKGDLYPLGFGQSHRKGDSLTSHSINLGGLQMSDSIYLSFFYQSGGLGAKPGKGDSLNCRVLRYCKMGKNVGYRWRNTR